MNRREKDLLRTAINAVAHHDRNAWWELKRLIWEGGYASYYPAAGDFDAPARWAVAALPSDTKAAPVTEWRSAALCAATVPIPRFWRAMPAWSSRRSLSAHGWRRTER